MSSRSAQYGLSLAPLALTICFVLSIAQMSLFGVPAEMNGANYAHHAGGAASSDLSERSLVAALIQICTEHGLVEHDSVGGKNKGPLFPTCPLCFSVAIVAFVYVYGNLLTVLRQSVVSRLLPLKVSTRLVKAFLRSFAPPRAPPSLWIAV